ncbi:MAG: HAD family hydrolase [Candidatus Hodarchaeota archaeon]
MMTPSVEKRHYKALIFDLNGTVVEIFKVSEYMENLKDITAVLDLNLEKFRKAWHHSWQKYPFGDYPDIHARLDDAFEFYFEGKTPDFAQEKLDKAVKLRMDYISNQHRRIREGVLDAFKWASEKGYKLGMISNCSIETAMVWPSNPMAKYIPDPTFSCSVHMKKPDPKIYLHECEKLGVPPSRCIYIADGDDEEFVGAKNLGMETILVKYDEIDVYRHSPFPDSEHVIEDFKQFPSIVDKIELGLSGK